MKKITEKLQKLGQKLKNIFNLKKHLRKIFSKIFSKTYWRACLRAVIIGLLKLPRKLLRFLLKSFSKILQWVLMTFASWAIGVTVLLLAINWLLSSKLDGFQDNFFQQAELGEQQCEFTAHNILRINSVQMKPLLAQQEVFSLPLEDFSAQQISWLELQKNLRAAEHDTDIEAVLIDYQGFVSGRTGMAQLRELLIDFKQNSGKKIYLYAQSLGNYHGLADFALHDIADEIILQPSGYVSIRPLQSEQFYLKRLLENLSVTPEFTRRHEYKSAPSRYSETGPSQAELQNLQNLLQNMESHFRHALRTRLRDNNIGDSAIFDAHKAVQMGVVDRLLHSSQLKDGLDSRANLINFDCYERKYADFAPHKVQIINIKGVITPDFGGEYSKMRQVLTQIQLAQQNDAIDALLVYVDSPGGDYAMSERIWHALNAVDKPVAVLMGNVAASGGYFVAAGADKIFAYENTVTGSIGIFSGHFVIREFLTDILKIDPYLVSTSPDAFSEALDQYPPAYKAQLEALIEAYYQDFLQKVSLKTGLSGDALDAVARGRVFSGRQALQLGLIDGVGGLTAVTEYFTEELGGRIRFIPQRENLDFADSLGLILSKTIMPQIQSYLYRLGILSGGVRAEYQPLTDE